MNPRTLQMILLLSCVSISGQAFSDHGKICIENFSSREYTTRVLPTDNFDWEDRFNDGAMNRPDVNWQGVTIKPHEVICRLADTNGKAVKPRFSFMTYTGDWTFDAPQTGMVRVGSLPWAIDEGASDPSGMPGRLHGIDPHGHKYACRDHKDPDFKVCSMFRIRD